MPKKCLGGGNHLVQTYASEENPSNLEALQVQGKAAIALRVEIRQVGFRIQPLR